jgi:anti-sigma B factor antagonist
MEVTTTGFKRCALVKVTGRVDSQTSPQLADALGALTDGGQFRIVLDVSETSFMSSSGLRVLINVQKTCKRWNRGQVVLAAVPQLILEALDLAGFVPLFQIFDTTTEAVASF